MQVTQMTGRTFGNYKVVGRLGEGGMGVVYEARHVMMGRSAAIKVLRPELASDQQAVGRFFNEARATSEIHHPGIVQIHDCGQSEDGSPWLVMELLDGETLTSRLARVGTMSPSQVINLGGQATSALAAAHAAGIIHRDLKPDNLFVVRDPDVPGGERLKVLDFGIAKLNLPGAANLALRTGTGMLMGTPVYMSPEQCRGNKEIDARSDIYSLGLIFYEMLAGLPPFQSDGIGDLLIMQMSAEPVPLAERIPAVGAGLARIVHRALQKNPADRQQRMVELQQELAAVSAAEPGGGHPMATLPVAEPARAAAQRAVLPVLESGGAIGLPTGATTLSAGAVALGLKPAGSRRRSTGIFAMVATLGAIVIAAGIGVASLMSPRREPTPPSARGRDIGAVGPASSAEKASSRPTEVGGSDPAPPTAQIRIQGASVPAGSAPTSTPVDVPPSISVTVTSVPSGARVVDVATGKALGVTPLEKAVEPRPEGMKLRIEKPGFAPRTAIVPPGHDYHQSFKLEKAGFSKDQEVIIKL